MNNHEPKIKRIKWTYEEKRNAGREMLQIFLALVALFLIEKGIEKYSHVLAAYLKHHGF